MDDGTDRSEHRSNRGALVIAGSILIAGIAIGAGIYLSRAESPPPSPQGERRGRDELILTGTVVMDGTTNGCGGENILV